MNPFSSAWSRYIRYAQGSRDRKSPARRSAGRQPYCRPAVEALEDRTVPTAVAVPSGLLSWWAGDGTAADRVGPNPGTLNNGVTFAPGEVASAFQFNTSSYVSATTTGLPTGASDRTMEMWVKVNTFSSEGAWFAGYGTFGTNDQTYELGTMSDHRLFFSQWGRSISSGPALQIGQWYHIAVTTVGGSTSLYLNGTAVATAALPIDTSQSTQFYIGRIPGTLGDTRPLDGLVDEVSVYNRGLSGGEILGIYKAGSDGKVFSPIAVAASSVVEGGAGTTTPATFTIQRTGSLSGSLTVAWTTSDDTANAGSDYVAASGTVVFADGEATKTVSVTVNGDDTVEPSETFKLVVTPASGTSIMGVATILTDDVSMSISNASATEGSSTLKFLDRFVAEGSGGLATPRTSIFGPDGNLYVASEGTNAVLRYDGVTGSFLDTFVASASGGLNLPTDLAFGPDGNLYVSSTQGNQVLRYDGSSGAFLDIVASGLSSPFGITFGTDGSLYIANRGTNEVLRKVNSGLSVFVSAGSGSLNLPRKAVFGPDGNGDGVQDLYVASEGNGKVLRYDGRTGAFIDTFATTGSTQGPMWLEFGTDGYLYATARTTAICCDTTFDRFNGGTGALVDSFAPGRSGWSFHIGPSNVIYYSGTGAGSFVDRLGPSSLAAFTVSLSSADVAPVTVNYSTVDGTALAGSDYTAASGTLTFAPGETTKAILIQTVDNPTIELSETFTVSLSSPVGATIANGTGVATILDNDSTKFYVVDDGSTDRTYRYGAPGNPLGNSTLGSGNTAPRVAAANAAGTTVWVVDSNKAVYVYNASGTLLGSWSAGGLNPSAQLEGLASNGTDIWLLDNKQDKVFKYTGAANRTSGSQSAASSFSLNNGNSNGKGIVTDGTSLWVVDDGSSSDKVFKYTLSGSLLGSWTIDAANSSPTGLTINPNTVSDIWVVDSGTDKVYQYTAAASRTSGSQNAAATFSLAAGNTNPQDIADPPAPDMLVPETPQSPTLGNAAMLASSAESHAWVVQPLPSNRGLISYSDSQRLSSTSTHLTVRAIDSVFEKHTTTDNQKGETPKTAHRQTPAASTLADELSAVDQVFAMNLGV